MCFFGALITKYILHRMDPEPLTVTSQRREEEIVISLVPVHKYSMRRIFQDMSPLRQGGLIIQVKTDQTGILASI